MKHKINCHWWNADACEVDSCPEDYHCYTPIKTPTNRIDFKLAYEHLSKEYKKLDESFRVTRDSLDKAIKALEKYACVGNWMGFENDGDGELWCNEFFVQYDSDYEKISGTTIYCAGRAARETLKEIRGEK